MARKQKKRGRPKKSDAARVKTAVAQAIGTDRKALRYAFKTVVRCPRCRSMDTKATSTQKSLQYRRCQAPICRHLFNVVGIPV